MKKKGKIMIMMLIAIIIIAIYVGLGYIILKQRNELEILKKNGETTEEVEVKPSLVADRKYGEDIQIQNIHFETVEIGNGETQEQLSIDLKNISDKKTENKWINIKFLDENNNEVAIVPTRIYELVPEETTNITISSSRDLKEASDFIIEERETPSPDTYIETTE